VLDAPTLGQINKTYQRYTSHAPGTLPATEK
jgi:hypothetical protein